MSRAVFYIIGIVGLGGGGTAAYFGFASSPGPAVTFEPAILWIELKSSTASHEETVDVVHPFIAEIGRRLLPEITLEPPSSKDGWLHFDDGNHDNWTLRVECEIIEAKGSSGHEVRYSLIVAKRKKDPEEVTEPAARRAWRAVSKRIQQVVIESSSSLGEKARLLYPRDVEASVGSKLPRKSQN